MSTYVIGDVQGCYQELQELLALIQFEYARDELWLVGDLVCRGPDSLKVLEFVTNFSGQLHCVLGNHDLNLLAIAAGIRFNDPKDLVDELLASEQWPFYANWLRHLPLVHYDPAKNIIMTHAGIYPFWNLDQLLQLAHEVEAALRSQNYIDLLANMYGDMPLYWHDDLTGFERYRFITNVFTRLRVLTQDGAMDLKFKGTLPTLPPNLRPWFDFPNPSFSEVRIIFGHWAALGGGIYQGHIYALDTGCVWGRQLTALRLEDNQFFHVNCKNGRQHG